MRRNKNNDVHNSLLGCPLEVVLESSWCAWGILGCLGDPLEASWGPRGPLQGLLGASWGLLGAS
eukprot:4090588-Pyramimonas_sp.AAC.1